MQAGGVERIVQPSKGVLQVLLSPQRTQHLRVRQQAAVAVRDAPLAGGVLVQRPL